MRAFDIVSNQLFLAILMSLEKAQLAQCFQCFHGTRS